MTIENEVSPRRVSARRVVALGTVAATALAAASHSTPAGDVTQGAGDQIVLAADEGEGEAGETVAVESGGEGGEGEGGGASAGPGGEIGFMTDLGFMAGHLRAGMALYEAGVLEEAKTHIGHPIAEKYDAVAEALEARGFGGLREQILALSAAAEAEADAAEVRALFDGVIDTVDAVRAASPGGASDRLLALAALTRIAATEYAVGVAEDGGIGNLHEYQDSWGFLRAVEAEARGLGASDDPAVAAAATAILAQVSATDAAFGDLDGAGIASPDPSILFGAAARMELAALALE